MRCPWEDTNHLSVSQKPRWAVATAMPSTSCIVRVASTMSSTFSASGTANGSSAWGVS
jgi:hypothetical protein